MTEQRSGGGFELMRVIINLAGFVLTAGVVALTVATIVTALD